MGNTLRRLKEVPYISIGLVVINLVVYATDAVLNRSLLLAGNLNLVDIFWNRQYGRILWSMFLHGDMGHLFNNMVILLFMGAMLEKEVGHWIFGSVYLLSGICGNVSSLIYKLQQESMTLSIGASGAVFGMDGLLLALVLFSAEKRAFIMPKRVIIMILLSLYNGFAGSNIDNAAHLGGLATGFVLGCLFCVIQRVKYMIKEKYWR